MRLHCGACTSPLILLSRKSIHANSVIRNVHCRICVPPVYTLETIGVFGCIKVRIKTTLRLVFFSIIIDSERGLPRVHVAASSKMPRIVFSRYLLFAWGIDARNCHRITALSRWNKPPGHTITTTEQLPITPEVLTAGEGPKSLAKE